MAKDNPGRGPHWHTIVGGHITIITIPGGWAMVEKGRFWEGTPLSEHLTSSGWKILEHFPRGHGLFSENRGTVPPNHPFGHRVFRCFHHPFWGTTILETPKYILTSFMVDFPASHGVVFARSIMVQAVQRIAPRGSSTLIWGEEIKRSRHYSKNLPKGW